MSTRSRSRIRTLLAVLAALAASAPPARAGAFPRDARLRIAGYFPVDLPTRAGTLWGLEFRSRFSETTGFAYGIYYFDEERTEFIDLNFAGTPTTFTFHAEVKLQPILLSWFRYWERRRTEFFAGGGVGAYPSEAFSGGFSRSAGAQVRDVGDFRFLEDTTVFGLHVYGGFDLFPGSRWGASFEGRFHLVEDNYSASEVSSAAVFRY